MQFGMSTFGGVHKSPRVTSTFLTLVPVRIHQTTSTLTTSFLFIPRNSWKEKADSIEPAIYETGVPNNFPLDSFPDFVIIPPSTARKYSRFDQTCPQPCPSFLPSFHLPPPLLLLLFLLSPSPFATAEGKSPTLPSWTIVVEFRDVRSSIE